MTHIKALQPKKVVPISTSAAVPIGLSPCQYSSSPPALANNADQRVEQLNNVQTRFFAPPIP